MKASGKGIGNKANPNSKSVFNAIKVSAGKSSGKVNANAKYTKVSAGKSSGGVNKPLTVPKRAGATQMRRGY
jgi:hypothetical protein